MNLDFRPLTNEEWGAFEKLFGEKGACAGCWCMFWRLPRKEFDENGSPGNKKEMKALVDGGSVPGIIAFEDDEPVGWCSVSPRSEYTALARSRILKPVDDEDVWSVTCFFIDRRYRGKGVASGLLKEAVRHAFRNGAKIVEGYPVEPEKGKRYPPTFAWHGVKKIFDKAGFREVQRRSPTRPIMRISSENK